MRGYMYTHGYRSLSRAREALERSGLSELPCVECGACPVRCAVGFGVRARAIDLFRCLDLPVGFTV